MSAASRDGPSLLHALELRALLGAQDAPARDVAWEEFVREHSRLLFFCARSLGGDRDAVMDRYTYLLEELARNDCRRLRVFKADGQARFTTWLAVTARRLCLDHHRLRYGRAPSGDAPARDGADRLARRRLADSIGAALDADTLPDEAAPTAEHRLIGNERDGRLTAALALLPVEDRLLVSLRFEEDLSAARIARVMGLATPFHVYRRLNRILAGLRDELKSRGVEGSDG